MSKAHRRLEHFLGFGVAAGSSGELLSFVITSVAAADSSRSSARTCPQGGRWTPGADRRGWRRVLLSFALCQDPFWKAQRLARSRPGSRDGLCLDEMCGMLAARSRIVNTGVLCTRAWWRGSPLAFCHVQHRRRHVGARSPRPGPPTPNLERMLQATRSVNCGAGLVARPRRR